MPISYEVDADRRRVVVTFTDPYTLEEWKEVALSLIRHPDLQGPFTTLVDRRESAAPTPAFVDGMLDFLVPWASRLSGVRAAVLVADNVNFGTARMVGMRAEVRAPQFQVRVFRDPAEADRWLTSAESERPSV